MVDKRLYTNNFKIPLLFQNQAHKDIVFNEALSKIDSLIHLSVIDIFINSEPENIKDGDSYIISNNPNDIFSNHSCKIAYYNIGWKFITPTEGMRVWVQSKKSLYIYIENNWIKFDNTATKDSDTNVFNSLAVNTNISDSHKLAICSNNSLFTTEDSSVRITLNKSGSNNFSSIIFQDDWQGKAEIGLLNNNNFVFKNSTNGVDFREIFVIENNSGTIDFKTNIQTKGINITGTRVGDYKISHYYDDHDRWMLCDGRELNKNNYKELYNIIGTEFGVPSNKNNFFIPNETNDFGRIFINY